MICAPQATTLAELLAPYLRAEWRDQIEGDGSLRRSARLGHDLCGSLHAERGEAGWNVLGWTHAPHPEDGTPALRLRLKTRLDLETPCAQRATRHLLEEVLTSILLEDLPAGRPWWSQVDLLRIEDIDGLHRALSAQTHGLLKARSLPDLLAELGQTIH
ncbi:hypothetical protein C0V75_03735 [Tabrizicola sp. TH137]|nr:hypothetical protein C0V75_03735 [Tabrizicola sp. TH137]